MNFADYMTIDNLKEIFKVINTDSPRDNEWRKHYNAVFKINYEEKLIQFLKDYNDSIGLEKIKLGDSHNTNFQQEWNRIVDKKYDYDYFHFVPAMFEKSLSFKLLESKRQPSLNIETVYNEIINIFNEGTFDQYFLSDSSECFECGQRLHTSFNHWKPEFFLQEYKNTIIDNKRNFESIVSKPNDCIDKKNITLNVNFPTGELLIADWFRINEFNETVSKRDYSINNAAGQVKSTKGHLEEFNMITIHLGNSSPSIFFNDDTKTFVFGRENEIDYAEDYDDDEEIDLNQSNKNNPYKKIGTVCTDLWNVSIIDKQDLINIVAIKAGDKATDIVENYIKKEMNSFGTKIVKVEPGEYYLNFKPNYYDFKKNFKDKEILEAVEPFFTLKKKSLTPKITKKQKFK